MRSATLSAGITEDIDEMMITEDNAFLENEDGWETENCDVANGDDPGDNEDETDMDGNSIDTTNDGLSSENVAGLVNTEDNEDVSDECSDDSIVLNCIFFDACGDLIGDSDGREKIDRDNFAKEDTIWFTESTWIVLCVVMFNKSCEEDATNAGEDALILVNLDEGQVKIGAKVKDWLDSIDANIDGLSSENIAGLVNTEDNEDVSDECSDDSIVLNCIFFDACGDLIGDSDGREKIDRDNFAKEDTIWFTESTWIVLSIVVFNKPFEEDAMNAGEDALILVKRNEGQVKTGAKVKDWFDDTSLTIRFRESVWGIWSWVAAFDSSAEWE